MQNRRSPGRGNRSAFGGQGRSNGGFRQNGRRKNFSKGGGRKKAYIDPQKFIKAAKPVEHVEYVPENSFADFDIHDRIKGNLDYHGFETPTRIQDKAIPTALTGSDILGLANTGTGKTVAFLLPLLHKLAQDVDSKAIIIAPTRELAQQIQEEARRVGKGLRIFDVLLIGGVRIGPQLGALSRKHQLIIGTPGRIKDHLERGTLDLSNVDTIVLDEVDRMLDMGFVNDIRSILSTVPRERQSLFFSATMDRKIEGLVQQFSNDPVKIVATTSDTSDNVEQAVEYFSDKSTKVDILHDLLNKDDVEKVLIFCDTKRYSDSLSRELNDRGFKSDSIHGDKSQGQRQRALDKLKRDHINILVATDVAARGIDVNGITHVINYDTPQSYEDYTHRIGRTGRGSSTGNAITFVEKKHY